ncbi:Rieske 2Fe-2S domain-containing protein [Nocardia sp. NPDC059239]|uniref:Rieske 2Fe-2S domain-containing protein n=1 Tax=Nocardia sp. NPDC059239 TaxID=3346785 RepID=UPI0036C1CC3E
MPPVSATTRRPGSAKHPRPTSPAYPSGWFAVGFSADVGPGQIVTCQLAGRDIIVCRSESGEIAASEPWCPHLGAHLGKGGAVTANQVRCPFHGFEFDLRDGRCVATPDEYGSVPGTARLSMLHAREVADTILVWHDPDQGEPQWEVTPVDMDPDQWLAPRTAVLRFPGAPQEVTENSVDLGHLKVLHSFGSVTVQKPLQTDGSYLRTAYSARLARVPVLGHLEVQFSIHVDGVGFSLVETRLPRLGGWRIRQFVLPTQVDDETLELRLAVSLHRRPGRPRWLWTGIAHLVQIAVMRRFIGEVNSDIEIWRSKAYLDRPTLVVGDGPIGPYRRWAAQFYRENAPTSAN